MNSCVNMMSMFRPKLLACVILSLCGLAGPGQAQESSPAHFLELPSAEQTRPDSVRRLYGQVSGMWQELRLDPSVDDESVRKQLDGIAKLVTALDKTPNNAQNIYYQLLGAQMRLLPSRAVEMRGALLEADQLPLTAAGMQPLMRKLKNAGFNAVFPEVFRRGYALFPNPLVEVDPRIGKSDLLRLVTDAAAREGLEVHPWFWIYRVSAASVRQPNVARRFPALMSQPLDGGSRSLNEDDGEAEVYMSPASLEWRQLMTALITRTARNYPVQGILMDNVRYGRNQTEDELSLTRFQLDFYKKVGSFPPVRIDRLSPLAAEWHLWREEQLTSIVRDLRNGLGNQARRPALGAKVHPNEVQARLSTLQNWRHWSNNDWIDYAAPMMPTDDSRELELWMDWESNGGSRHDLLYPILSAQTVRGSRLELLKQITVLQQAKANGIGISSLRSLTDPMLTALAQGPFRTKARPPHSSIPGALAAQLKASATWLRGLDKRGAETKALSAQTRASLPGIAARLESAAAPYAGITGRRPASEGEQAIARIRRLSDDIESETTLLPARLHARLRAQMQDALELAQIFSLHVATRDRKELAPTRPPLDVLPEAQALPSTTIKGTQRQPDIDGDANEPAWSNSQSMSQLFWSSGSARPQVGTEIRLTYDERALYVSFLNDEPRTDRLRISRDDIAHKDDTVQVFLSPTGEGQQYYHFVVNPANVRYQRTSFDSSWNGRWSSATRRFAQGWSAELQIPFESLGVRTLEPSRAWKANFCRRRPQEAHDFHCWSPTLSTGQRAERFGSLNFEPLSGASATPESSPTPEASPSADSSPAPEASPEAGPETEHPES